MNSLPTGCAISEEDFSKCKELANSTLELFRGRRGHYSNSLNSHLRGKIGEFGGTLVLERLGFRVRPLWSKLECLSEADVEIDGRLRLDVKTWDRRYWPSMGRCIAVNQLPRLRRKASAILWCVSDSQLEPGMTVQVVGWNTLDDVAEAPRRLTGPPNGRQVDNYQVDEACLRNLESLRTYCAGL